MSLAALCDHVDSCITWSYRQLHYDHVVWWSCLYAWWFWTCFEFFAVQGRYADDNGPADAADDAATAMSAIRWPAVTLFCCRTIFQSAVEIINYIEIVNSALFVFHILVKHDVEVVCVSCCGRIVLAAHGRCTGPLYSGPVALYSTDGPR